MSDWQKIPFYLFFIVRPDGNAGYTRMHEQYPLKISVDSLLGAASLTAAMNNLQTGIVPQEIVANRKQQIEINHKNYIKSFITSTFQMRFYDSISGYRFILIASNSIDQKKIDSKLEEIYKVYVNYVLKAPFLNKQQKIESVAFRKKSDEILYR